METTTTIQTRGSGSGKKPTEKKSIICIDTLRLRQLSDQLSELVDELDDIKEDLNEMLTDLEDCYDENGADADEEMSYMKMDSICGAVDSAYTELNEALDRMEELA